MTPAVFALIIFLVGLKVFAQQPETKSSYFSLPHSWDDRCAPPHFGGL
jgi:hypothetical protein